MGHRILYIPAASAPPEIYYPEYGLLYNWYATQGTGNASLTSSDDWVVPTTTQRNLLVTYLATNQGGKLKETGFIYWSSPNTGATNETGFNGRGGGIRTDAGTYSSQYIAGDYWCSNQLNATNGQGYRLSANSSSVTNYFTYKKYGNSIRLLYTGTGTPTSYVGNDGKEYRIVTIGTQIWLADNLAETKFRNGTTIPWYGANPANYFTNAEWAALTTAGCCAYNNTLSNVGPGFSFPT